MPYTNTWTTTVPTGSEALSTADNEIRKLRLDIEERMETLGLDWAADPVVTTTTKYHYIPWSSFFIQDASATEQFGTPHFGIRAATSGSDILYAPVILPRGAVVSGMVLSGGTSTDGTITCVFQYTDATTGSPAETIIATISVAANTAQTNTAASSFSHTIDSTPANYKYYMIKITLNAGTTWAQFQGVRLTYTVSPFGGI